MRPILTATLCAALAGAACHPVPEPELLADVALPAGSLTLEETDDAPMMRPVVFPDTGGGWIVTESQLGHVTVHDDAGRLVHIAGRPGNGPGELEHPLTAFRREDGHLVVLGFGGRLTEFGPDYRPVGSLETGMVSDDLSPLPGGRVLVSTRTGPDDFRIVVWNVRSGVRERAFAKLPPPQGLEGGYRMSGNVSVVVRGDTVAVLHGLQDTLRLFRTDGTPLGTAAIPFKAFHRMTEKPPLNGSEADFRAWMSTFSVASSIDWLPGGGWLVRYFDVRAEDPGSEPRWRALRMDARGRRLFDVALPGRLLARRGDTLFVLPDGSETPARWLKFRLKDRA